MLRWKKRAEQTPREEVLLQEIENLKKSYQEELHLEKNKRLMNKSVENGLDSRVQELESRVTELARRNANFEHERFELQATIENLQQQLFQASNKEESNDTPPVKNTKLAFVKLYEKLKLSKDFDLFGRYRHKLPFSCF